jgi:hypothetical protein
MAPALQPVSVQTKAALQVETVRLGKKLKQSIHNHLNIRFFSLRN